MSPGIILLFSGKRKCGKDFITDRLKEIIGDKCEILKISLPIKSHWSKAKNLDLDLLLDESIYKEKYRLDMILWSEEKRASDYGYFCRITCENASDKPIWIVSDIRRKTDIKWFTETYDQKVKKIRITADDEIRKARGFQFTKGVDDAESECNLDDFSPWDLIVDNGTTAKPMEDILNDILALIKT